VIYSKTKITEIINKSFIYNNKNMSRLDALIKFSLSCFRAVCWDFHVWEGMESSQFIGGIRPIDKGSLEMTMQIL